MCVSPSPESQTRGWPMCIVNDQLFIGVVMDHGIDTSQTKLQTSSTDAQALLLPTVSNSSSNLTEADKQKIVMLSSTSGVDAETATRILFQCQGDMQASMQQVQASRH